MEGKQNLPVKNLDGMRQKATNKKILFGKII